MRVIDAGRVYELDAIKGGETQRLTFVAAGGGGVTMEEVLRALIARLGAAQQGAPCIETAMAQCRLMEAVYMLEQRAARLHGRELKAGMEEVVSGAGKCEQCGHVGCQGECLPESTETKLGQDIRELMAKNYREVPPGPACLDRNAESMEMVWANWDGRASAKENAEVKGHLAECVRCRWLWSSVWLTQHGDMKRMRGIVENLVSRVAIQSETITAMVEKSGLVSQVVVEELAAGLEDIERLRSQGKFGEMEAVIERCLGFAAPNRRKK